MTPLYPRWGFLDKFAVNEYLAKSLLLTVAVWLAGQAGVAVWQALRPEMVRLRISTGPPITDVVIIERYDVPRPLPVGNQAPPRPTVATKSKAGGDIVIIDGISGSENWDAQGVKGGTGTESFDWADGPAAVTEYGQMTAEAETWLAYEREPELISMQSPAYPELAREAGIEGEVLVRVLVGTDGFVHAVELAKGVLGLDDAALAAARTAVFRPAEQQGRAVAAWMVIPIEFSLHGD
jgi:protein TonB